MLRRPQGGVTIHIKTNYSCWIMPCLTNKLYNSGCSFFKASFEDGKNELTFFNRILDSL